MARPHPGDARAGQLYVVALPIGQDSDLSPHAREVLGQVSRIACEDTRVTRRVLQRQGIRVPELVSYHDHNEQRRVPSLIAGLQGGNELALVSDAGTPLIADPGYRLVVAAIDAGIEVRSVPGPCAAIAALAASGLPTDRFLVLGFLPRDAAGRRSVLGDYASVAATVVLYVAPHRLGAVFESLREVWGTDRRVALVNDLTKTHERWWRGPMVDVAGRLADHDARGEFTLVVQGASRRGRPTTLDPVVDQLIAELGATDLPAGAIRDVVSRVYGIPRRDVYQRVLHHQAPAEE